MACFHQHESAWKAAILVHGGPAAGIFLAEASAANRSQAETGFCLAVESSLPLHDSTRSCEVSPADCVLPDEAVEMLIANGRPRVEASETVAALVRDDRTVRLLY